MLLEFGEIISFIKEGITFLVGTFKDLATAVAAIVASIVAVVGLSTWKRQLKGTAEYDIARTVLKAVYQLRNAIGFMRNPFMSSGEIISAMREAEIETEVTDQSYQSQSTTAVFHIRWRRVLDALTEFEVASLEAEALWGSEVKDKLDEINRSVSSLYADVTLYLQYLSYPERMQKRQAYIQEVEMRVYGFGGENDKFYNELSARIQEVENYLRQYLKK